jgi:Uma2 family endonuclease
MTTATAPDAPPTAITPPPAANGTPAAGPVRRRWTRDENYRMGELGFFDGQRVELIDGEVVVMSPINETHVFGVNLTARRLWQLLGPEFYVRVQSPLDFGPDGSPEPDIAVVRGDPRAFATAPATAEWVFEVAESSLAYDTGDKVGLYAAAGVPDYWVLDLVNRRLIVYRDPRPDPTRRFGHGYFQQTTYVPADSVAPLAAPSATIAVAELLP